MSIHMCPCYAALVVSDSVTLWTIAHQAPLSMGFSRKEYWSEFPCPPPWDLPNPGIEPMSLLSPGLRGGLFTTVNIWEAQRVYTSGMKSWMANSDWIHLEYDLRLYFRQASSSCWSFWCSDQIWGTKVLRLRSSLHPSFNPPIPAHSLLLMLLVLLHWHLLTFECLFSV